MRNVADQYTERQLMPSSKVLDAYMTPPQLRPAERTTPEQRRRSRDHSQNLGQPSDVQPTDPLFVLRKVNPRGLAGRTQAGPINALQNLASPDPHTPMTGDTSRLEGRTTGLSPQEIIAAQRAATRANQRALISAHTNTNQGVDVVLPDKGTFRSSRLLEPNGGEVVRYSFIDDDGQTYDISEILEEELGVDGSNVNPNIQVPPLVRHGDSSQSNYVTAPSTPLEQPESGTPRGSEDILRGVLARSQGQPEGKLEEKLSRVISKVKSWRRLKSSSGEKDNKERSSSRNGHTTPAGDGRAGTPQNAPSSRTSTPQPPGGLSSWHDDPSRDLDVTPRAYHRPSAASNASNNVSRSDSRNDFRQGEYKDAAASVNRIISRHHQRQQPSIASIMSMSDVTTSPAASGDSTKDRVSREPSLDPMSEGRSSYNDTDTDAETEETETETNEDLRDPPEIRADGTRSSTPLTATSSTHPTPPFSTIGMISRLHSTSPTGGRVPVSYADDFGLKNLMAIIDIRSRDWSKRSLSKMGEDEANKVDEVQRLYYGEDARFEGVHPEIKDCYLGLVDRLGKFDRDVDEVLALVPPRRRAEATM